MSTYVYMISLQLFFVLLCSFFININRCIYVRVRVSVFTRSKDRAIIAGKTLPPRSKSHQYMICVPPPPPPPSLVLSRLHHRPCNRSKSRAKDTTHGLCWTSEVLFSFQEKVIRETTTGQWREENNWLAKLPGRNRPGSQHLVNEITRKTTINQRSHTERNNWSTKPPRRKQLINEATKERKKQLVGESTRKRIFLLTFLHWSWERGEPKGKEKREIVRVGKARHGIRSVANHYNKLFSRLIGKVWNQRFSAFGWQQKTVSRPNLNLITRSFCDQIEGDERRIRPRLQYSRFFWSYTLI